LLSQARLERFMDTKYLCSDPPAADLELWAEDTKGATKYDYFQLSRYLARKPECYSAKLPPPRALTLEYYTSLPTPPVLAIGVISAADNTPHRLAMRSTWLAHPLATHAFFLALPPSGLLSDLPLAVLVEASLYDDIFIMPFVDSYLATPAKSIGVYDWGVKSVGGYYTLRSNDDVYLDLGTILSSLSQTVPTRVYGLLAIEGKSMRIPRPSHFGHPDTPAGQSAILESHRAWTFLHEDYFGQAVPDFCQGNAVLLSNDLGGAVAGVRDKPWAKTDRVADDILIALLVSSAVGDAFKVPDIGSIGYEHEGRFVRCENGEGHWFNIHPEYFYELHGNKAEGRQWCDGIDEVMCCGIQ